MYQLKMCAWSYELIQARWIHLYKNSEKEPLFLSGTKCITSLKIKLCLQIYIYRMLFPDIGN